MKNTKEIGEVLKKAREEKKFSIEKVCKATRMQKNVVEALEDGTAESILGRVYIILFLKKYAFLLGLDGNRISEEYKEFLKKEEPRAFDIGKSQDAPNLQKDISIEKQISRFATYAGIFLFVLGILFLALKINSFYASRKNVTKTKTKSSYDISSSGKAAKADKALFPIPGSEKVILTLKSSGEAWMKIKEDNRTIFEGTLRENETKTWSTDGNLELWVGRAEVLDFTVNGRLIGKIGRGNMKNIELSRKGLMIGRKPFLPQSPQPAR